MNNIVLKFNGPKLISVESVIDKNKKVSEVVLTLRYPYFGKVVTKVTRIAKWYNYYDEGAPLKNRKFNSVEDLIWEYELPMSIIPHLKKL